MKIVTVIPVRMGSGRLPGKVMRLVQGNPLLGHLLDRLSRCHLLDETVVATSTNIENDVIENYCSARDVLCFRGSELDVMDRVLKALLWRRATDVFMVWGDCPLLDPSIVTEVVDYYLTHKEYDFVGNDLRTTYPPGMEVEIFSIKALADSAQRCGDMTLREHSTLYIRTHPEIFRIKNLDAPKRFHRPDLFLGLDVKEDLTIVRAVMDALGSEGVHDLEKIIDFMDDNPHLGKLNRDVPRRWKKYRDD